MKLFLKNLWMYYGILCSLLILIYLTMIPFHTTYNNWAPVVAIIEILLGVFIAISIFIFQYLREKRIEQNTEEKRNYFIRSIRNNLKVMRYLAGQIEKHHSKTSNEASNQITQYELRFDHNLNNIKNIILMLSHNVLDSKIIIKSMIDFTDVEELRFGEDGNENKKWRIIKKNLNEIDNKLKDKEVELEI